MLIQNINSSAAIGAVPQTPTPQIQMPQTAAPVELPQVAVNAVTAQPTAAQVKSAVDDINNAMKQNNSNVEFSIDPGTKQDVIKVMDTQTGLLISQFPSREALAVSQMIAQSQNGALVKQKA